MILFDPMESPYLYEDKYLHAKGKVPGDGMVVLRAVSLVMCGHPHPHGGKVQGAKHSVHNKKRAIYHMAMIVYHMVMCISHGDDSFDGWLPSTMCVTEEGAIDSQVSAIDFDAPNYTKHPLQRHVTYREVCPGLWGICNPGMSAWGTCGR